MRLQASSSFRGANALQRAHNTHFHTLIPHTSGACPISPFTVANNKHWLSKHAARPLPTHFHSPFSTAQRYHPRLKAEDAMLIWADMRLGTPLSARTSLGSTVTSCTSPALTPSRCRCIKLHHDPTNNCQQIHKAHHGLTHVDVWSIAYYKANPNNNLNTATENMIAQRIIRRSTRRMGSHTAHDEKKDCEGMYCVCQANAWHAQARAGLSTPPPGPARPPHTHTHTHTHTQAHTSNRW